MAEFAFKSTDQRVIHTQDIIKRIIHKDVLCMYNTAIAAAAQCLTESFKVNKLTMDSIHINNPNSAHIIPSKFMSTNFGRLGTIFDNRGLSLWVWVGGAGLWLGICGELSLLCLTRCLLRAALVRESFRSWCR